MDKSQKGPPAKVDIKAWVKAKYGSGTKSRKTSKKTTDGRSASLRITDTDLTGFADVEDTIRVKEVDPDAPVVIDEAEARIFEESQKKKKEKQTRGSWHTIEQEELEIDDCTIDEEKTDELLHGSQQLSPTGGLSSNRPNEEMSETIGDLSPPRRLQHQERSVRNQEPDNSSPSRSNKPQSRRMLDGTTTGVVLPEQLRRDNDQRRQLERRRLLDMEDAATGKGAETVHRNKDGHRVSKDQRRREHAKKKATWETPEWSSGLVQQRNLKVQKKEREHEKAKPFARSRDDDDLDALNRARQHWDDPMRNFIKRQRQEGSKSGREPPPVIDNTNRHWFERSGFVVPQDVPEHSWLKRGVTPPANRYNIKPGRHWDGVNRSNGYEKEYLKYTSAKKAYDKDAAAWRMEDM